MEPDVISLLVIGNSQMESKLKLKMDVSIAISNVSRIINSKHFSNLSNGTAHLLKKNVFEEATRN